MASLVNGETFPQTWQPYMASTFFMEKSREGNLGQQYENVAQCIVMPAQRWNEQA